jgi:hypothetical protein
MVNGYARMSIGIGVAFMQQSGYSDVTIGNYENLIRFL